jgi:hypothetical protein
MSCSHRYYPHGCDQPPPPDWYDAYGYYRPRRYRDDVAVVRGEEDDFDYEEERPRRRRASGRGQHRRVELGNPTEAVTAASLRSQAEALRDELTKIEQDLEKLSAAPSPTPEEA